MGYAFAVIVFFVAWKGLPSTVFLPYAVSFIAGVAAFLFIKFLRNRKSHSIATSALVFAFFIVAVIGSLSFPASMADGEHFRSIVPFLNVSFR